MKELEKQQVKKKILQEIQKTSLLIEEYKELTKPIPPENAIGRVSRMDAINNKSVVELALKKAINKLKNLKKVEKQLEGSNFGSCIRCSQTIPLLRLLLVPESRKCVNCA